ncbi:MAG TPA: chorismate mutase [Gaiellaceae bacterium]|nr:chorismate mutase [Gaiellaceae bacterium]
MSELEELRAEVAAADREILAAVNRRLELVRLIGDYKRRHGIAFVDPEQERRLVAALQEANAGPLSAEGVRELFEWILALVKRELEL